MMPNLIEFDATNHPIHSVVLFQSQCAEICRKVKVPIVEGQNEIEIKNLPSCMIPDSIRVEGIGKAAVFDVVYHRPEVPVSNFGGQYGKIPNITEQEKELLERRENLEKDIEIFDYQSTVLTNYSGSLSGANANADQLENFLSKYATRKKQINEETYKLKKELAALDDELREIRVKLNANSERLAIRGVRISVTILGDESGEVELSVTYLVTKAVWLPHYDMK